MENKIVTFTINSGELRKGIALVGNAVPGNALVPACENIHCLVHSDGNMILTATDTHITISTQVKCSSVEIETGNQTELTIPFKFIAPLLAKIANQPITLEFYQIPVEKRFSSEVQRYAYSVRVLSPRHTGKGNDEYKMECEEPADFPKMDFKKEKSFKMSAAQLKDGIGHCKEFYDVSEARPGTSGIRIDMTSDLIDIVAMKHSGCAAFTTKSKCEVVGAFTLPDSMVKFLSFAIPDNPEGEVSILLSQSAVKIRYDGFVAVATLLVGEFSNYREYIGMEVNQKVKINIGDWRGAIDRSMIFSNDKGIVRHQFKDESLTISSDNANYQTSSNQCIDVNGIVEEFDVAFDGALLKKGISGLKGEITIGLIAQNRPLFIYPDTHSGESLVFFLAPIRPDL